MSTPLKRLTNLTGETADPEMDDNPIPGRQPAPFQSPEPVRGIQIFETKPNIDFSYPNQQLKLWINRWKTSSPLPQHMLMGFVAMLLQILHERGSPGAHHMRVLRVGLGLVKNVLRGVFQMERTEAFHLFYASVIDGG